MTEYGNAESVRADRVYADKTAKPGIKARVNGIKSSVSSTVDAAKVMGRLTPKQLKDEVQIAKLELKTKGIALGKGVAVAAVGLLFGLFLLIALISAAILGLGKVMEPWLAALVLALVFLILMAIFAFIGYKMIKKQMPLKPESALFGILYDLGVLKHGSDMTSSRVKREQEEKAAKKEAEKKEKAENKKTEDGQTSVSESEPTEDQLKLRTKQRRDHLKALRDDLGTYTNDVQAQAQGLVGSAKVSAKNAPSNSAASVAEGGRRLGRNASDPEVLKARWGSFATLAASVSAFFVFLGKLIRR